MSTNTSKERAVKIIKLLTELQQHTEQRDVEWTFSVPLSVAVHLEEVGIVKIRNSDLTTV